VNRLELTIDYDDAFAVWINGTRVEIDGGGAPPNISNDAFVHVETASGDYVTFVDQPGGSVGDPIKLFGGQPNAWAWTGTRALDRNGKWPAQWDLEPGVYVLVVQGRSQSFRIDRMVFFDTERGMISGAEGRAETR